MTPNGGVQDFSVSQPSGHVFRVERRAGRSGTRKYRLPDGRQVQRKIGPAWTERGRPPAGYYTKRLAEEWLRDVLDQARRGTLAGPGPHRRDVRRRRRGVPALRRARPRAQALDGPGLPLDRRRRRSCPRSASMRSRTSRRERDRGVARRDRRARRAPATKALVLLHGIFERARKVCGLPRNPVADVEKPPLSAAATSRCSRPRRSGRSCARPPPSRTRAIFLTAAFTGLRHGRAARAALARRRLRRLGRSACGRATPSGRADDAEVRQGPLGAAGAGRGRGARAARRARALSTGDDDLVFPGRARRLPRRLGAAPPLQGRARSAPGCGRCASTTCATRSGRG